MSLAPLALGTVQWGSDYGIANRTGRPDLHAVREMLTQARRAGVLHLDTARAYGDSEAVIGALTQGDPRWQIATKLAPDLQTPDCDAPSALARVGRSLCESRRALRRDRLDVVLLHRAEHRDACGGLLWRRLRRERAQQQIGALGISTRSPDEAFALLDDPEVEVLQVAASLFDQRLARAGFFEQARAKGKRVHVRSVFLQGVAHLAPDALPRHLRACRPALLQAARFARQAGLPVRHVFLAYARSLACERVVVGCERPEQLGEILADCRRAAPPANALQSLAASLPEIDPRVLDPSQWAALAASDRERPPLRHFPSATYTFYRAGS